MRGDGTTASCLSSLHGIAARRWGRQVAVNVFRWMKPSAEFCVEVRERLEAQTNNAVGSLTSSSQIVDCKFCRRSTYQAWRIERKARTTVLPSFRLLDA